MAQFQTLALPSPVSESNYQDMETQILHLRTKLAFVNDRNFALRAQLNVHI